MAWPNLTTKRSIIIQQLIKKYNATEKAPKLEKNRRSRTYLTKKEKEIIDKVGNTTKRGTRLLYHGLRIRGYKILHNKIHAYLKPTGRTRLTLRKERDIAMKENICRHTA